MSVKERERAKVLERVSRGEMTLKEAADMTGVSYWQMKRLRKRFEKDGDQGLVHRGRGKPGNRGYKEELKRRVIDRYREKYPDFGPTLAAEKMEKEWDPVRLNEGLGSHTREIKGHKDAVGVERVVTEGAALLKACTCIKRVGSTK
jgi:transposase